jgi:DNA repair exonuclease SbcCD ATPase subunit
MAVPSSCSSCDRLQLVCTGFHQSRVQGKCLLCNHLEEVHTSSKTIREEQRPFPKLLSLNLQLDDIDESSIDPEDLVARLNTELEQQIEQLQQQLRKAEQDVHRVTSLVSNQLAHLHILHFHKATH